MAPLPSFVQIALCLRVFIMCVVPGAWPELDKATRATIFAADLEPRNTKKLAPYVFILNAFSPEAASFYGVKEFNLLAQNITVPGFSPRFLEAHCTSDGKICQATTGEGEVNAAGTISALIFSHIFVLKCTYFLIAGIAGIDPNVGSTGSVTFARFEVQVALQYEFDIREIGNNFSTGYIPFGATEPLANPVFIYGTEVFEINDTLRHKVSNNLPILFHRPHLNGVLPSWAINYARMAKLNDTVTAQSFRNKYNAPGNKPPAIIACDGATSDVFYNGNILSGQFAKYVSVITNGIGKYCATAQEDTAILSSLLRGAKAGLVDFGRIIAMRTAANCDRPPPGVSTYQNFFSSSGGFGPRIASLALAGTPIVEGIVKEWEQTYTVTGVLFRSAATHR